MYVALTAGSLLLSGDRKKSNDHSNNSKSIQPMGYNQQRYEIKQAVEHQITEANEDLLREAILFKDF